jgi:hypothetical protein
VPSGWTYLRASDCTVDPAYAPSAVTVDVSVVTYASLLMFRGARFVGTVTDADTGRPDPGACLDFTVSTPSGNDQVGETGTDQTGHYRTGPINPGTVRPPFTFIRPCVLNETAFTRCQGSFAMCGPLYVTSQYAATIVPRMTLGEGQTVTLNVEQAVGGEVDGTVTTSGGQPVSNIMVTGENSQPLVRAFTDSAGHYRLRGLQAGLYYVSFSDSFTNFFATLGPYTIGLGQVITGVNATKP